MSAYLDKSQGVTFVFSNIYSLYTKAKYAKLDEPFRADRVLSRADALKKAQVEIKEFKPRQFTVPMGVQEAEAKVLQQRQNSMENLKKNLDSLKDAHAKLRFLLKELEEITKK